MKTLVILLFCITSFSVFAGQKAVTDQGDVVILNEDGTWVYEGEGPSPEDLIPLNSDVFSKNDKSSFALKSLKTNTTFSINPKLWRFTKNGEHDSAEYTFELKNGDLYGMAITEQVEIDIENLSEIAFENARSAAPDAKIVKREYRIVNGQKVIYMEIVGTLQNIKFKYLGYYYSNASGSVQYLAYTSTNLADKYQTEIDSFLNGLSVAE